MAKSLLRSHFVSICNNMTVKQHINHGAIQKLCYLHNGIFHSKLTWVTLSQFYPITSFVLLDIKEDMAVSVYHIISREVENRVFRHNRLFRRTCMYNPCWQSSTLLLMSFSHFSRLFRLLLAFRLPSFYVQKKSFGWEDGGERRADAPHCLRPWNF